MDKKNPKSPIGYIVAIFFLLAFMVFLYLFISENKGFFHDTAKSYGLVGIFIGAIVSNATIFLPIPFDAVLFFVGASPQLVGLDSFSFPIIFVLGLFAGFGAAIGEMTAYIAGLTGVRTIEQFHKKEFEKLGAIRLRLKNYGMWFIFFGLLTPFPFDIIGITAGIIKYDAKKFFVAAAAGKTVRYTIILLAGHYGFEIVQGFLNFS